MKSARSKLSFKAICCVSILILTFCLHSEARVRGVAHKSKTASDLRSVILALATHYYSNPNRQYDPAQWRDMESLLIEIAKTEFIQSEALFNDADKAHFDSTPPKWTGRLKNKNDWRTFELDTEILNFPIGFNVAVYPNLDFPTAETPILWTRGLHRYSEFEAYYGGHVAYLDGHVRFFSGGPNGPEPELEELFGPDSIYSQAIHVLEHEPDAWKQLALPPLPIRVETYRPTISVWRQYSEVLKYLGASFLIGLLFAAAPNRTIPQRFLRFFIASGIALIVALILLPGC